MYVLLRYFVVALVVIVVATVSDILQRGLPWLQLILSIATLFVPTGEKRSDQDSSLIGTRSNFKSSISIGGAAQVLHGVGSPSGSEGILTTSRSPPAVPPVRLS
jgi:hypothetical protein